MKGFAISAGKHAWVKFFCLWTYYDIVNLVHKINIVKKWLCRKG